MNPIRRYTTTYQSSSPYNNTKHALALGDYESDILQLIANLNNPTSLLLLEIALAARQADQTFSRLAIFQG